MLEEQKRAERLGDIIVADAKHIAAEIIENAKNKAEELVKKAQEKYKHDEEEDIIQDKHDTSIIYAKELSYRDFKARKEVLSYRNQKVNELFETVCARLEEYTSSDEYTLKLKELVDRANEQIPLYDECIVYHRAKDEEKVRNAVKEYRVTAEIDKTISIGGISVYYPKENIYINFTFDFALARERKDFANHSELSL